MNRITANPVITQDALAHLGDGTSGLRQDDPFRGRGQACFRRRRKSRPACKLFALHAADGTPIMLTDTREAALANAWSQELEAVSVH